MARVIVGVLFWTLFSTVASELENPARRNVTIWKCCRFAEELKNKTENSIPECVSTNKEWAPNIYSSSEGKLTYQIPSHWRILENRKPHCPESHVLTYKPFSKSSPYVLIDPGKVIVNLYDGRTLDPEEYCADLDAILTCELKPIESEKNASPMRPSIIRCCGVHAAYDEIRRTCVISQDEEDAPPLVPNMSSVFEIKTGFPHCSKSSDPMISGDVKDALLESNGSLVIKKQNLRLDKFCVEKIWEQNHVVKFFSCSDDIENKEWVKEREVVKLFKELTEKVRMECEEPNRKSELEEKIDKMIIMIGEMQRDLKLMKNSLG